MAEWHANIGSDSMARNSYPGSLVMLHNPSACTETSAESILSRSQANGVSLQSFTSSLQPEATFILNLFFSYRQFTFEECQGCLQKIRGICCHQEITSITCYNVRPSSPLISCLRTIHLLSVSITQRLSPSLQANLQIIMTSRTEQPT
jgi:hypothetical protein